MQRLHFQMLDKSSAIPYPSQRSRSSRTVDIGARSEPRVAGKDVGDVGIGSIWVTIFLWQLARTAFQSRYEMAYTLQDIIQPAQCLLGHAGH